ncbi:hypothetical protein JOM56_013191 [Amanita muscaria]
MHACDMFQVGCCQRRHMRADHSLPFASGSPGAQLRSSTLRDWTKRPNSQPRTGSQQLSRCLRPVRKMHRMRHKRGTYDKFSSMPASLVELLYNPLIQRQCPHLPPHYRPSAQGILSCSLSISHTTDTRSCWNSIAKLVPARNKLQRRHFIRAETTLCLGRGISLHELSDKAYPCERISAKMLLLARCRDMLVVQRVPRKSIFEVYLGRDGCLVMVEK